jgi:indoleamine 2,3-dioxygenase
MAEDMASSFSLENFDISMETGFLPAQEPLKTLPEKFRTWDDIADRLKQLIRSQQVREKVENLPMVTEEDLAEGLSDEAQWWRAYVVLSYICHAYVWCEGEKGAACSLPRCVAVPWSAVSNHLGIAPVVTHSAIVLYNWKRLDERGPLNEDNVTVCLTFTGSRDEEWFSIATFLVELAAAKAIAVIPNIYQAMEQDNNERLISCLLSVNDTIRKMQEALSKMRQKCQPKVFYTEFRPYLGGWKGNDALPEGLVYTGVSDRPLKLAGGNAGQSTSLAALDILLCIQHTNAERQFLLEQRDHMPRQHRRFLQELEKQPCLRDYIKTSSTAVIQAYNTCLESVINFRSEHIRIVTLYILCQMSDKASLKGTGGSGIMDLLKTIRKDVEASMIPV